MATTRRDFLQTALGGSTLLAAGLSVPAFLAKSARAADAAGDKTGNVLVVIQLSGGNDGLNTVIPYADKEYEKHRIALRIGAGEMLKVNDHIGLHPSLSGFSKLLEEGKLAIVQGIGYPNPDRSHFRSMDIWHSARPETVSVLDGWLGRSLDAGLLKPGMDVPALHLGPNQLPLALISQNAAVPSVESLEGFRLQADGGAVPLAMLRELAAVQRAASGTPDVLDFIRRSTLNAYASSEQVQQVLSDKGAARKYPEFPLARKLESIAQLIDAGLSTRIYYVELDGFDTHSNQAAAHSGLLSELSESTKAFVDDLTARGHQDRVAVLTFSEFGRRVHENASQGTDHGTSAPVFLCGGKIKPGTIGDHPSLTDLDGEGDMKFHTDFRRIYATLLDQWLGCPSAMVLGGTYEALPLLA